MIAVADQIVFGPPDMPLPPDQPPYGVPWWQCTAGHQPVKWCGDPDCWFCRERGMPAQGGFVTHHPQRAAPYFPGGAAREMEGGVAHG